MARLNYISTAEYVPMSIQDLLVPLTLYKEAYEKSEAEYKDLTTKSNAFAYLSQSAPEGSKARAIYEKYANDLRVQAEDIARNGLSMSNRSALASLGQRYSGEIGMLESAQKAMEEHKKTWMAQRANDPSMLFATNTFTLDDYLYGNTPNMYAVSGNELYKKGVALGAAASSRMFRSGDAGSTLAGMYRDYVQIYGYSPETIAKFRRDMSVIPELQQGVMDVLRANGVTQNLKGEDLMRAAQQVMNGAVDGAVYKETHDLKQDLSVMTAAQRDDSKRAWASLAINNMWKQKEYELKLAELKAASDAATGNTADMGDFPTHIFTNNKLAKEEGNIKLFDRFFTRNERTGEVKLTKKGLEEYNRGRGDTTKFFIPGATSASEGYGMSFKTFVDDILGGEELMKKKRYEDLGNKFAEYRRKYNDALRRTRYEMPFAGAEDYKRNKNIVLSHMGPELFEAEMTAEDKEYRPGKALSREEFTKDDYTLVGSTYSPYGETLIVQDKDGNTHHYISPEINFLNEKATKEMMQSIEDMEKFFVEVEEGKRTATDEEMQRALALYKLARQKAALHHSQKWGTAKTKSVEYNSNYSW